MSSAVLFVYGSLKRGGRHHDLLTSARFLGVAETPPGYALEQLGEYLALAPRHRARAGADAAPAPGVPGELFEVDSARLPELDAFEGDDYVRSELTVREMSGDFRLALAYLKKPR